MEGKSLFDQFAELRENLQEYIQARVSYYALLAFEKSSRLLTVLLNAWVVSACILLALLFLSASAAIYLGRLWGALELGLLAVGGFYILLALFFFLFRNRLFGRCVIRSLARMFFGEPGKEETKK